MTVFLNANILKLLLTIGVWSYHCYGDGFVADLLLERLRLLPPVHKYALEWLRLCTGHPGVLVSDKRIFDSISQDEEDEAVAGARSGPASFIKNDRPSQKKSPKKMPPFFDWPRTDENWCAAGLREIKSRPPKDQETCRSSKRDGWIFQNTVDTSLFFGN